MTAENTQSVCGLTLGSLFDGSGGFPLGGLISGVIPVWASEIEPFPIRVTTKRMPFIKHYGDIPKVRERDCFVYIMHEERPIGIPSMSYFTVCCQGYDDFGFDPKYLVEAYGISHKEVRE